MDLRAFFRHLFLLSLYFLFFSQISFSQEAQNNQKRKVKVGFMTDMPYLMNHNMDSDLKSGYGYDYLQMISNFTNWEYEYIYGEWHVLFEKLLKGEIDILEDVSLSPERKNQMLFPENPMGKEIYRLYILDKKSEINPENIFETLNGKKVGISAGTIQCEIFTDWVKKNNIKCEILEFLSDYDRNLKFAKGSLDAIVELESAALPSWEPIIDIGSTSYYIALSKGNEQLLEELNYALKMINFIIPTYRVSLIHKYYARPVVSKRLSHFEKEWIENHKVLRCGYSLQIDNSYETIKEILEEVVKRLRIPDLKLQFQGFDSSLALSNALQSGKIDVAYPLSNILSSAEARNYSIISDISSYKLSIVTKKDTPLVDDSLIGVLNEGSSYFSKIFYPKSKNIRFNTIDMLLKAVVDEKINAALVPEDSLPYYLESKRNFSKLNAVRIPTEYEVALVCKKSDTKLFTLLKRGFSLLEVDFIGKTIAKYSKVEVDYSISTFIKNNLIFVLCSLIFLFALILVLVIFESQKRFFMRNYEKEKFLRERLAESMKAQEEHRRKEKELLYLSETDKLTGIANRGAEGKIRQFIEIGTIGVFCLFDVDKFKSINDNYGHIIGDKVLIAIAECMKLVFRDTDIILRLGGDEFAVFMLGVSTKEIATSVINRFFAEIEKISIPELSDRKICVSLGATLVIEKDKKFEEIYKRADTGCYISKRELGSTMSFV